MVKPQFKAAGRLKKLRELHNQTPLEYLEERPTAYRDEMEWFSWDEFNPAADESTISRDLGWNRKKAARIAKQRNPVFAMIDDKASKGKGRAVSVSYKNAACERTNKILYEVYHNSIIIIR